MSFDQRPVFQSLYSQYQLMVLQMCMGFMKGDKALALDLSQEVFINVWNALPKFRAEASYKTWIYRITVNTCLQHVRKKKNAMPMSMEEVAADKIAAEPDTADEENSQRLYYAIGQLEKTDRLIIMMVMDGLEQDKIVQVTGINANNLRVKIHRIKQRLTSILKNERDNG